MITNFTKEYVELCKNKKIQKLCPVSPFFKGDYGGVVKGLPGILSGIDRYIFYIETDENDDYKQPVWLPYSDQLDDEIIKICRKRRLQYHFYFNIRMDNFEVCTIQNAKFVDMLHESTSSDNLLIAKILLLIKLLEEAK